MARDLRVLIPTAGRNRPLGRTLDSLAECHRPDNLHEVVVIENGPAENALVEVQRRLGRLPVRYVHVARPGKSHALNCVLEPMPSNSLVYMTDDDVRFQEDTLVQYAQAAEGMDRGQYFGGPIEVEYETPPTEWLKEFLPPSAVGWRPSARILAGHRLKFLGLNWAAFVGDIRRAGGFDPDFGPGSATGSTGQETQMQRLMQRLGVTPRFLPAALVRHYVPGDRCSMAWALHRAYRHGLQKGLGLRDRSILLAAPLCAWSMATLAVRSVTWGVTRLSIAPQTRCRADYDFQRARGWVEGCWMAMRPVRHVDDAGSATVLKLPPQPAVSPPQSRRAA